VLNARVNPRVKAKVGDTIKVAIDMNKAHLFDKETEKVVIN
jgi:multiple sugar transport system ATP-binding protein